MWLTMEMGANRRHKNLPTSNEVTVILLDEFDRSSRRDIVLTVYSPARIQPVPARIDVTHAAYMPLHYVLLFPYGDYGKHL